MLLTNCYLFQTTYSLPTAFKIFFYLPFTFPNICNFCFHYNAPAKLCYQTLFLTTLWTLKMENFHFVFFVFSISDDFPEKTYEKSCYFYNIFKFHFKQCRFKEFYHFNIFFPKKCRLILTLLPIFASFTSFVTKLMKRPIIYMPYSQTCYHHVHRHIFLTIFLGKFSMYLHYLS